MTGRPDLAADLAVERTRRRRSVSGLAFASPAEIRARRPASTPWVWEGYLARGALSLFAGKPKAGKSTLITAVAQAVAANAPHFLGCPIVGGPVVYVTEEGADTALDKLEHDALRVLTREAAWPKPPWRKLVQGAVAEARSVGAGLIVFDTFAAWSGLSADQEKDAGAIQQAIEPLLGALRAGLAVALVHHQRKAGGEGGDAVRGSSALPAAVDVIVEYERPAGDVPAGQRQIVAVGRWPQTPGLLLVEREAETGGWRVVGHGADREEVGKLAWRERLLQALPTVPPGIALDELEALLGASRKKWHRELRDLLDDGLVSRSGGGRKGDPFLHCRAADDVVQEFRPEPGTESGGGVAESIPSLPSPPRRGAGRNLETDPSTAEPSLPWRDGMQVELLREAFDATEEPAA